MSTDPVLKNLVSSFKCLVWVIVRISSQSPLQRGWRTRISSQVRQQQTTGHTWNSIPEFVVVLHLFSPHSLWSHPISRVIPKSRASVLVPLLLKQMCKQLRKDRNTAGEKMIQSIPFQSAVFLSSSLLCSAKKKKYKGKKNPINRLLLLYISAFKYVHIEFCDFVSTWARSSWPGPFSWPGLGPFAQSDRAGAARAAARLSSGPCGSCCASAAAAAPTPPWWRGKHPERCSPRPWRCTLRRPPPRSVALSWCPGTRRQQKGG